MFYFLTMNLPWFWLLIIGSSD